MKYEQKNNRYSIGLGLYFTVTKQHIDYPGKWICRSNIPHLDFRLTNVDTEEEATQVVQNWLKEELNID